jgi:phosphatidylglycerophosphatase A
VASGVAMLSYFLLSLGYPWQALALLTGILLCVGWWATAQSIVSPTDDPAWIVIDEWVAVWLLCLCIPYSFASYALALIVFRVLDIAKPWPVSLMQKMPGVVGIFADDFLAAVLAAIFLCCGIIPGIL